MQNDDYRLPIIYDALNSPGTDDDFFLTLANETPHARVLDLGCGTGRLTVALAQAGHYVTGIDPDNPSLMAAKAKPGADKVTWQVGTSAILPDAAFDLALMTSHVAQFIVDDGEWAATLNDLRRSLVPDGRLAFDSRDPTARAWESWNPANTTGQVQLPDGTHASVWNEVERVSGEVVIVQEYTVILETQETNLSSATFRFRTEQELKSSLAACGFDVENIFGGWNREPVGRGSGELIVIARAGSVSR